MQALRGRFLQRLVMLEMQQSSGLFTIRSKIRSWVTPSMGLRRAKLPAAFKASTYPARTGGRQMTVGIIHDLTALSNLQFFASASLAAPGSIRQRQFDCRSLPGSFIRVSRLQNADSPASA